VKYKDYYAIMGIDRGAKPEEIKRVYRRLARKYHPDVSKEPDAEERFKEVNEAYEVLKDPEKRRAYDQLGANWRAGEEFRPPPGWDHHFEFRTEPGFSGLGDDQFSDFFESLFGNAFGRGAGRQGAGMRTRGGDQHLDLEITVEEAFGGGQRTLRLQTQSSKGAPHTRTLNVHIPAGVTNGQQIRLAGQGSAGVGGPSGDLFLTIHIKHHPRYRVEGKDLFIQLPIAPWEAALGANIEIASPAGRVGLKVPPGSQTGRKLRLKGRGLPGRPAGDLYAVVQIVTPEADTESAQRFYQDMAETFNFDPRAKQH